MAAYLQTIYDLLFDLPAQVIIGGVMVGLVLSLILTGLYILLRRKAAEPMTLMAFLMLVGCTLSMAMAAGYMRYSRAARGIVGRGFYPAYRALPPVGPATFLSNRILSVADIDRDGRLSHEEASQAVVQFMQEADAERKGSLDSPTLDRAIWDRLGPPPVVGGPWLTPMESPGKRIRQIPQPPAQLVPADQD